MAQEMTASQRICGHHFGGRATVLPSILSAAHSMEEGKQDSPNRASRRCSRSRCRRRSRPCWRFRAHRTGRRERCRQPTRRIAADSPFAMRRRARSGWWSADEGSRLGLMWHSGGAAQRVQPAAESVVGPPFFCRRRDAPPEGERSGGSAVVAFAIDVRPSICFHFQHRDCPIFSAIPPPAIA